MGMAGQLPLLIHSLLHLSNMWLLSSYYVPGPANISVSEQKNRSLSRVQRQGDSERGRERLRGANDRARCGVHAEQLVFTDLGLE